MVFIHAPVREDQDIGSPAVSPVTGDKKPFHRVFQRGALVVQQGNRLNLEAGVVHMPDFQQLHGGENRVFDLQHLAVFRQFLQQIAIGTHKNRGVRHDLLPDGVNGRVGHLGKQLLEVVEQGLMGFGQDGQRNIHTHGRSGLRPVFRHGQDGVLHLLIGVAKGLV